MAIEGERTYSLRHISDTGVHLRPRIAIVIGGIHTMGKRAGQHFTSRSDSDTLDAIAWQPLSDGRPLRTAILFPEKTSNGAGEEVARRIHHQGVEVKNPKAIVHRCPRQRADR